MATGPNTTSVPAMLAAPLSAAFTSNAMIRAIPFNECGNADSQGCRGPESGQLREQGGARPCRRHVTLLHRQVATNRLASDRCFDERDEIFEADRPPAADIDDTIGRLCVAGFRRA